MDEARPSLDRERLGPAQPAEVGATSELLAVVGDGAAQAPSTRVPRHGGAPRAWPSAPASLALIVMALAVRELRRPADGSALIFTKG